MNDSAIDSGDDGLAIWQGPEHVEAFRNTVDKLGMKVVVDLREPGQTVEFLARIYSPQVWHGDLNSICQPFRQLAKFHTSTQRCADTSERLEKLFAKALSYWLADANTPFIGPFVTAFLRSCEKSGMPMPTAYHDDTAVLEIRTRYGDRFSRSVQYPNEKAPWMDDVVVRDLTANGCHVEGYLEPK